jgi:riboflavin-specific deaminase-like protein
MQRKCRITLSYAQSLDGRIATKSGDSKWISGNQTLSLAQELRRDHDAIAVGIGTVLRDDPLLTCRIAENADPLRVIFDGSLRIPLESQIVTTAGSVNTIVFHGVANETKRSQLEAAGIIVARIGRSAEGLDVREAVGTLEERGVRTLFVEGGSALITSFLRSRLVDRVVCVIAPIYIGSGTDSVSDLGVERLADAWRLVPRRTYQLGNDLVWELDAGEE